LEYPSPSPLKIIFFPSPSENLIFQLGVKCSDKFFIFAEQEAKKVKDQRDEAHEALVARERNVLQGLIQGAIRQGIKTFEYRDTLYSENVDALAAKGYRFSHLSQIKGNAAAIGWQITMK
jgi:hypothetical protein